MGGYLPGAAHLSYLCHCNLLDVTKHYHTEASAASGVLSCRTPCAAVQIAAKRDNLSDSPFQRLNLALIALVRANNLIRCCICPHEPLTMMHSIIVRQ